MKIISYYPLKKFFSAFGEKFYFEKKLPVQRSNPSEGFEKFRKDWRKVSWKRRFIGFENQYVKIKRQFEAINRIKAINSMRSSLNFLKRN